MKISLLLVILCVCRMSFGEEQTRRCSITFRVIDQTGEQVPYRVSSVVSRTNHNFAGTFEGLSARLPCGKYAYELVRQDGQSAYGKLAGTVEVRDPENWHTVVTDPTLLITPKGTFTMSRAVPPGFVLRGRVLNGPANKRFWVRMHSAFGAENVEAQTDPNGEFRMYRLVSGQCFLYVMDDRGIVYVESIQVVNGASREALVIDLARTTPVNRILK